MNILESIKDSQRRLKPLHDRMDKDASLANLDPFVLKSALGHDLPGAQSVTMNDAAVYLNAVIAWITSAREQLVVEGNISSTQQRDVEKFLNANYAEVDERLIRQKKPNLKSYLATHICGRGWIGGRWYWVNNKEDGLYLDALPVDARYCYYDVGDRGFEQFANASFRSVASINKRYPSAKLDGDDGIVLDHWDNKLNRVYVGKLIDSLDKFKQVDEKDNPYKYPPFVLVPAPEGFMFFDQKTYVSSEGQSVFFLDRDMYETWNRLNSIDVTMALRLIDPSYQKQTTNMTGEIAENPPPTGAVIEVEPNSSYELLPVPDLNRASNTAHENISRGIQRGGISDIDLASPAKVTSALWITEQEDLRSKIIKPRLDAIQSFMVQSSRMIIDQYIQGKFKGELGKRGSKSLVSYSQLVNPDDYDISYKMMSKSKRMEIANLSIAASAKGVIPRLEIMREIINSEDPEGDCAELDAEEAAQFEPALKYFRMALGAARMGKETKEEESDAHKIESILLTRATLERLKTPASGQGTEPNKPRIAGGENVNQMG